MELNNIKKELRKFFRGEETEEGRWLIDQWYRSFKNKPNELTEYSNEEKEKFRRELWTDIKVSTDWSHKHGRLQIHGQPPSRISWPVRIAAGFIIVLLALLPVLYFQGILLPENQNADPVEYQTISNPPGQSSQVTLSDGSTIWLSAASTLRYPDHFGDSLREVNLKGEAFFDVKSNPDKPFVVNSGQLRTRVLGTSFNIRVFEDEEDIQVTVASGRVSVEPLAVSTDRDSLEEGHTDPIAVLKPEQQLVFDKKTQTGMTQAVESTLYTSWKDGKLIFDKHSFEEIARRLERWYGVNIQFADPALKQIRFKVTFNNNSLEHALQMLKVIEDFEFEMEGNQVWIKPISSQNN